ncbi:MAG: metal-sensing transcriptional repressor [Actinobacteria bacterium]|nr:metal-sensing transcriptional repressor [Actinomycetota bacterium]
MNEQKKKSIINFKKAQSLLGRIIDMVEEDEYCIDIMQQNLAVLGMLKSANRILMEGHLNDCFSKAIKSGSEKRKQEMIQEILQVTKLSNK